MPERETLNFSPDRRRRARLLRLARESREENSLPDAFCRWGLILFALVGIICLFAFGYLLQNRTWLTGSWTLLSLALGLPVLTVSYARQAGGRASWHHRFVNSEITLDAESLELTMTMRSVRGPEGARYRWVLPYETIHRMEYDRSLKVLRVYGLFDREECELPANSWMPAGMTERPEEVTLTENDCYVDILLYYEKSNSLIRELESRTGVFVHTAMRADDYAELRDLPGLKPDLSLTRPAAAALLLFTAGFMLSVMMINRYYEKNPYRPFPPTAAETILKSHGIGEKVTLDGCEITVEEVSRAAKKDDGSVCYVIILSLLNTNDGSVRMRVGEPYRGSPGNITARASVGGDDEVLEFSPAPPGFAGVLQLCPDLLEPGRSYNVTLFLWLAGRADSVTLSVNSDYWPPRDIFRDIYYTGGTIEIDGTAVKDNEVRFVLPGRLFN